MTASTSPDSARLESIDTSLRLIAKLMFSQALPDSTNKDKVKLLFDLGMQSTQISELTGIPMTSVSPLVSKFKKASSK